jgi:hypothetical protein
MVFMGFSSTASWDSVSESDPDSDESSSIEKSLWLSGTMMVDTKGRRVLSIGNWLVLAGAAIVEDMSGGSNRASRREAEHMQ